METEGIWYSRDKDFCKLRQSESSEVGIIVQDDWWWHMGGCCLTMLFYDDRPTIKSVASKGGVAGNKEGQAEQIQEAKEANSERMQRYVGKMLLVKGLIHMVMKVIQLYILWLEDQGIKGHK